MAKSKRRQRRRDAARDEPVLTPAVIDECLRGAAATVKEVERQLEGSFLLPPGAVALRIQSASKP